MKWKRSSCVQAPCPYLGARHLNTLPLSHLVSPLRPGRYQPPAWYARGHTGYGHRVAVSTGLTGFISPQPFGHKTFKVRFPRHNQFCLVWGCGALQAPCPYIGARHRNTRPLSHLVSPLRPGRYQPQAWYARGHTGVVLFVYVTPAHRPKDRFITHWLRSLRSK